MASRTRPSPTTSPPRLPPPLKQHFLAFHYTTSFFVVASPFFWLETSQPPAKDKQDFNRFQDASSQVIFLFQRNFRFWSLIFSITLQPPLSPQRYMQFQYKPWCSPLKRIRSSTELFIKNFFLWCSPHLSWFKLLNYNPLKRYMQFQWQFHPASLFPSHLPNLTTFRPFQPPNLTTLPPFPYIQPHQLSTLPIFSTCPPSNLSHLPKLTTHTSTIKALQNKNIKPSLSTLVFKRRFTISELKDKFLILPFQETISDHWIWALIC